MAKIEGPRAFIPVRIAVLTVSNSRTLQDDRSGDTLVRLLAEDGHELADRRVVADDRGQIAACLRGWIADPRVDAVVSTGGTGLTGHDITPEAFEDVVEKTIPGFGELFRHISFAKIGPSALQSRAMAGVANGTYLFALPGSTGACEDAWEGILRPQLDARTRPCNFVELMPRLREHLS